MKIKFLALPALALVVLAGPAAAETGAETEPGLVIPTEPSEPPYAVGDLVVEQGYYIEREDEPSINFRIVDNRIRIYWIDENGLVAEPEVEAATVRFTGSVRGRPYHRATTLPEGAGLGAPGLLPPPHLFNVILVLDDGETEEAEPTSYSFRYLPAMDTPKEPETVDSSKASENEGAY